MWQYNYSTELTHYGILGMKWGHHKIVESVDVQKRRASMEANKKIMTDALRRQNKETHGGLLFPSKKTANDVANASLAYKYSKEDLGNAKILDKLKQREKSKSQLSMEEKYKQKGMTPEEASVAAYKNIRTKKVLAVVGGMTVAAATAYAAYKYHDNRVDKILKSGTLLQNISADSDTGIRDAFYSANNKLDKIKYKGLYGESLQSTQGGAFKKEVKVLSDIRQASPKNAQNILTEMVKNDPEFASNLKNQLTTNNSNLGVNYDLKTTKAEKSIAKGIIDKNVYEVFNASLVDHDEGMQKLTDRYFKALSENGYNAIRDVNDSKYSGYNTSNPILTFGSAGKVVVTNVEKLTDAEINKSKMVAYAGLLGSELVKTGAAFSASFLTGKGVTNALSASKISEYRKKHPDTKMSNTEIIRSIERGKTK